MTEDDDLFAGEYVVGCLSRAERDTATARRNTDPSFDAAILAWERVLGPASEAVPPSEVSPGVWPAILAEIRGRRDGRQDRTAVILRLETSLRRWKTTARAAMAIAAVLALWVAGSALLDLRRTDATLVAVLEPADHPPSFVVLADLRARALSINSVAAQAPAGKSFELWIVDPSLDAPKSLGVLGADGAAHATVAALDRDLLGRATYAVTVEPAGGSPSGRPSGTPLYTGHLLRTGFRSP